MNDRSEAERQVRARPRRWPWVVLGIVAVLALGIAAGYRWLASDAALRYLLDEVAKRSNGALVVQDAHGSLLSTVHAREIAFNAGGTKVRIEDVDLTWSVRALMTRTLHVDRLAARHVTVTLAPPKDEPLTLPDSLALPFRVEVAQAKVDRIDIERGDAHWAIEGLALAYEGGPDGHHVRDLALASDPGTVTGRLSVGARRPFALDGEILLTGSEALHNPRLRAGIGGSVEAVELKADGTVASANVRGNARFTPLADITLPHFELAVNGLDLHALGEALPQTALDATIVGNGVEARRFEGTLAASNAMPGALDANRIPLRKLESRFVLTPERIAASQLVATLPNGGTVAGSGNIALAPGVPGAAASDWNLALRDVDLRSIYGKLVATRLAGTVKAEVAGKEQHVVADVRQQDMALAFDATVSGTRVNVARLQAHAGGGDLTGNGRFDWSGDRSFTIAAKTTHLDPARFGDFPKASLDSTVEATGKLQPAWTVTGRVALAPTSSVRGSSVSGAIAGTFTRDRVRDVVADLHVGSTTLTARGSLGAAGDRMQYAFDGDRIEALAGIVGPAWPQGLAGTIHATGHVDGTYDGLGGTIDARVRQFGVARVTVGSGTLVASVPPVASRGIAAWRTRPLTVDARADGLSAAGSTYTRASVHLDGTLAQHTATLALVGNDVDASAEVNGGVTDASARPNGELGWQGTIVSFQNRGTYAVHLLAPTHVEASAKQVIVRDARIAVADGTLRVGSFAWMGGRISSEGDFTGIPVAAIARLAGKPMPLRSTLVIGGDWNVEASPRLNGRVNVRRQSGDIYAGATQTLEGGEIALGISQLDLSATLRDDTVNVRATLRATRLGNVDATAVIGPAPGERGPIGASSPLTATIKGELLSLRPLQPLIGTAAIVDGALTMNVSVRGTLGEPVSSGAVLARNLRVDAPKYGLAWHDGHGGAVLADGVITLENVSFAAGDGRFSVSGTVPLAAITGGAARSGLQPARLTWQAKDFRATNRPDLRLVVSGEGTLGMQQGHVALSGELRLEEGQIDVQRNREATLSSDVVVMGRPKREEARTFDDLPLVLDLRVDLGRRLHITGQGLAATLRGEVQLTNGPRGGLRAKGTLYTIDGTYVAFGQRLTIDRGRITFDGPVDNPALDVVALRKNLPVEAGVQISGTAKLPQVQLTSNPPVPDGEKLSWLVLGQGLERNSGADLAALQAAAGALFGQNGPGMGTRIAQRVGLDDLSLRSSGTNATGAQNQVLAVSKRLTDRIYLTFEQGLNAAESALRVDYTLTRSLTLRAKAGQVSSLGIYFLRSFE